MTRDIQYAEMKKKRVGKKREEFIDIMRTYSHEH